MEKFPKNNFLKKKGSKLNKIQMYTISNWTKSRVKIGILFDSGLDLYIRDFVRFEDLGFWDFSHHPKIIHALNF